MLDRLPPSDKIYSAASRIQGAGRGVFAKEPIEKDDVIESCPVIVVPQEQAPLLRDTELYNYYFMWGGTEETHKAAIALGFGSLYNHSYEPNATYRKLIEQNVVQFVAIDDIAEGEEITVNYNYGDPDDKSPLWIKSIIPPGQNEK